MPTESSQPKDISLIEPGETIAGKYRIERVIAMGGMGVVFAARHEDLDQQVAIKLLRSDAVKSEEAVKRFLREAKTAARLQSEHVARVFDVGTAFGSPYMVMEYLSGKDLQEIVETRGALPIDEAVDYTLQTLEALAEAHTAGVVHRDLKPSNVFIAAKPDGTPRVKVLDFGISKENSLSAPAQAASLTATRQVIGSPGYMSPEQMLSPKNVDHRTDIWSIGVLLFELLSGKFPFTGETVAGIMTSVLNGPLPKLRSIRPEIPEELEHIVERCMSRDAEGRYGNVAELARELVPFGPAWAPLSLARIETASGAARSLPGGGRPSLMSIPFPMPAPSGASIPAPPSSSRGFTPNPAMERKHPTAATWSGTASKDGSKKRLFWIVVAASALAGAGIAIFVATYKNGTSQAAAETATASSAVPTAAAATSSSSAAEPAPSVSAASPASAAPTASAAENTSAAPTASASSPPAAPIAKPTGKTVIPIKKKKTDPLGDRE